MYLSFSLAILFWFGNISLDPCESNFVMGYSEVSANQSCAPQHSWLAYHLLRGCESIECFTVIPFFNASLDTEELSCGLWLHNESPH